jgi:hypothetical protein
LSDTAQNSGAPDSKLPTVGNLPSGFKAQFDRWILGLAVATTQGGATAVKAFFGAAGASALGLVQMPPLDLLKQTAAVFVIGAGYHFFDYLESNPLLPNGSNQTKN